MRVPIRLSTDALVKKIQKTVVKVNFHGLFSSLLMLSFAKKWNFDS